MNQETWTAVDRYYSDLLLPADPALDAALASIADNGLPPINVTPTHGKFLHLLATISGAKNILEIGTLAGYSTIWLARAMSDGGRLITLEQDEKHARIARENFSRAGLSSTIELIPGNANDTLPCLAANNRGPFEFIFIDADKVSTANYFTWALKLSRPGSVIVVDNVVRRGAIIDAASGDKDVQGVRRFNELLAREKRVSATALQTVGSKGYDGLAVLLVQS